MSAPLTPGYREVPLWQVQEGAPEATRGAMPLDADCVIVGGGYCGLAAAWKLAEAGRHAVVVDQHDLGWGASTRNGGMVIPELKAGPGALAARFGDVGRRMYAEVHEAFDLVESLCDGGPIACDYVRSGRLYLAHHDRVVRKLAALAADHAALGEAVRFLEGDELAAEIGSPRYRAGVLFERTGALHPARFHAGLAALAKAAGAELFADAAALEIERPTPGRFRVSTTKGTIATGDVIVATNAYADGLVPELRRQVLPVGSYVVATETLPAEVATAISPRGRMFVDSKNFLFYWRLSPDGRMVFGGRRSLAPVSTSQAREFLYRSLLEAHPQLAGVRVAYAWDGNVAMTRDRLPHFGRIDGVVYATGCNGAGVALNTWLGTRAAAVVCGESPPAFSELDHSAIPLHALRRAYLPVVGLWFRLQDSTGMSGG